MSFIPGANVGPYRIVEQAERNGIATTYTAYQPAQGRYVSVIVVPAIGQDDVTLQRQYQRQIELVLSLRHPNVLTVLDRGEHLGVPFIVTELVEAEPLSDRLGAPWPLTEVVRVLKPIAVALDFAHGYGVVHGDLQPPMVLLTPDGTPILSGFGVSTRRFSEADGEPTVLEPGQRTPSVSTEIMRAQAADRRGLALIAFEMLTGRTMQVESADFERPLPPARLGSPLLTPPVEKVLLRELTRDRSERYPDSTTFIDDLSSALTPATPSVAVSTFVAAPPADLTNDLEPSDGRRRLLTVAAIFIALAALGALAMMLRGGDGGGGPVGGRGADASPTAIVSAGTGNSASGQAGTTGGPGASAGSPVAAAGSGQPPSSGGAAGAPGGGSSGAGASSPGTATNTGGANPEPTRSGPLQVVIPTPDVPPTPPPLSASRPGLPGAGAPTGPGSAAGPAPGGGPVPSGGAAVAATKPGGASSPPGGSTTPPGGGATAAGGPVTPSGAATTAPASGAATTAPSTKPAANPTRIPATWRILGDASGRWAFDDQGRIVGRADEGASLLLFPETVEDVTFSAQVSTPGCQATLVFRAQDDENLLMAIYIPDGIPSPGSTGGGIWLYQRVEGLDVPIRAVRPSTMKPAGEPVQFKVATVGPQITVSLNDEPAVQAVDTAAKPGKLGLMIYSATGRPCEATFGDIRR